MRSFPIAFLWIASISFHLAAGDSKEGSGIERARALADREARYDEAVALFRGIADGPEGAPIASELAEIYERLGEIEAAAEMYERALGGKIPEGNERLRLETRLDRCRRQRLSLTQFPVSLEAASKIREAGALIGEKRWAAGFGALDGLLREFQGTFLQEGAGEFLGLWEWARAVLEGLGPDGLEAYRGWARKPWEDALLAGDEASFRKFIARFPGRREKNAAFISWAEILADQGKIDRAVGIASRSDLDGELSKPRLERWSRWAAPPGEGVGLRAPPDIPVDLTAGWSLPLPLGEDSDTLGLAAADGRFFIAFPGTLEARDLETGRRLWNYAPSEPADRRDIPREIHARTRQPRRLWAGRLDPRPVVPFRAGILITETYDRGDPDRLDSVLTCLDPETGAVRWRLNPDGAFRRFLASSDPVESGGTVLVTAVTRGEYPEYWLFALDGEKGEILWKARVASGAAPAICLGSGALHAGHSGPTLAAEGARCYYATHLGAVVAFDRDLGELLWAVSYPRVPRFGPMTAAPLPLLERRTEPIRITPRHLLVLPRDLNGLLVIDRSKGKLERVIRSLDLLELIDGTDDSAVVRTVSGEIRSYSLEDGKELWSLRPQEGGAPGWAARAREGLLTPSGGSLLRLDPRTGSILEKLEWKEPAELRIAGPGRVWAAVTRDGIRVLRGERRAVEAEPMPAAAAWSRNSDSPAGWSYRAFFPTTTSESRLLLNGGDPILIASACRGLSAYSIQEAKRLWWRPFDGEREVWGAQDLQEPGMGAGPVAISRDRERIILLNPKTGAALVEGKVEELVPIRSVHVAGEEVLVAGTSILAGVRAAGAGSPAGGLQMDWRLDFTPSPFGGIFSGKPALVFLQPSGGESRGLLKIDPETGKTLESFTIAVPMPLESGPGDREESRFPVKRLSFRQEDLRKGLGGLSVIAEGREIAIEPCPVRVIERGPDFAVLEAAEYWVLLDLAKGNLFILSPQEASKGVPPSSAEEKILLDWLKSHPGHGRGETPRFRFEGSGLRFIDRDCPPCPFETEMRCGAIIDSDGKELPLGGIEPRRIEVHGDWLLVSGHRGTLVLSKALGPGRRGPLGKEPVDFFKPAPVQARPAAGLVLDGDLSDWPRDGWLELSPERYEWPPVSSARDQVPPTAISGSFLLAMDERGIWLGARIRSGGRPVKAEVLLTGFKSPRREDSGNREAGTPITIFLSTESRAPVLHLLLPGEPALNGRIAGMEGLPIPEPGQRTEDAALAFDRGSSETALELRLDRRSFAPGEPMGFDLRIAYGSGSGGGSWLEWGGALGEPLVAPPASLIQPR